MKIYLSNYSNDNINDLVLSLKTKVNDDYNKRAVVDKRDLRDELSKIEGIPFMLNKLLELRKISDKYEIIISIAYKGYVRFALYFPITENQFNDVIKVYDEKRKQYGCCVRRCEQFYNVLHKYVENMFDWIDMEIAESYGSYAMADEDKLVRELEFIKVKRY